MGKAEAERRKPERREAGGPEGGGRSAPERAACRGGQGVQTLAEGVATGPTLTIWPPARVIFSQYQ